MNIDDAGEGFTPLLHRTNGTIREAGAAAKGNIVTPAKNGKPRVFARISGHFYIGLRAGTAA